MTTLFNVIRGKFGEGGGGGMLEFPEFAWRREVTRKIQKKKNNADAALRFDWAEPWGGKKGGASPNLFVTRSIVKEKRGKKKNQGGGGGRGGQLSCRYGRRTRFFFSSHFPPGEGKDAQKRGGGGVFVVSKYQSLTGRKKKEKPIQPPFPVKLGERGKENKSRKEKRKKKATFQDCRRKGGRVLPF